MIFVLVKNNIQNVPYMHDEPFEFIFMNLYLNRYDANKKLWIRGNTDLFQLDVDVYQIRESSDNISSKNMCSSHILCLEI